MTHPKSPGQHVTVQKLTLSSSAICIHFLTVGQLGYSQRATKCISEGLYFLHFHTLKKKMLAAHSL